MASLSFHPEIMLPPAHVPWLLSQPDSVMDLHEVIQSSLSFGIASPHDAVLMNPFHDEIVKRQLTRHLEAVTPAVVEELGTALDEQWDLDTDEWHKVCIWESMQAIIARTSNRVFVGLPLCRDKRFLHHARAFAVTMVNQIGVVKYLLPAVLAPLLGHIFALPCHFHDWAASRLLIPTIETRLAALRSPNESSKDQPQPNDLLQWLIQHALSSPSCTPADAQPRQLASRILILNFAALHTSTITMTNLLLSLLSSPDTPRYLSTLRTEAKTTLAAHDNIWSKAATASLVHTDSTLRETLRDDGLGGRSLVREVITPQGVTTPDGTFLPQGVRVGVPAGCIHHDDEIYANANTFNAFRFVHKSDVNHDAASEYSKATTEDGNTTIDAKAQIPATTTSPTYLPFGHGRRACPGRFFASHELKLLLALIVMRYDISLDEPVLGQKTGGGPEGVTRPANEWMSDFSLPPRDAGVWVRRRRESD